MRHFRLNHLKDIQLAISPELGYEKHDLQSTIALKFVMSRSKTGLFCRWLKWYAAQEQPNLDIRHRDNGGEVRFGKYRVDGFLLREPQARNKVLEFNGCAWHGKFVKCNSFPKGHFRMPQLL